MTETNETPDLPVNLDVFQDGETTVVLTREPVLESRWARFVAEWSYTAATGYRLRLIPVEGSMVHDLRGLQGQEVEADSDGSYVVHEQAVIPATAMVVVNHDLAFLDKDLGGRLMEALSEDLDRQSEEFWA